MDGNTDIIIPHGEKIKDLKPGELLKCLLEEKRKEVLGRNKTVRLEGEVTCQRGSFKFEIFIYNNKIINAELNKINTSINLKGMDALKVLATLVYDAISKKGGGYKVRCSVYKVDKGLFKLGKRILTSNVLSS